MVVSSRAPNGGLRVRSLLASDSLLYLILPFSLFPPPYMNGSLSQMRICHSFGNKSAREQSTVTSAAHLLSSPGTAHQWVITSSPVTLHFLWFTNYSSWFTDTRRSTSEWLTLVNVPENSTAPLNPTLASQSDPRLSTQPSPLNPTFASQPNPRLSIHTRYPASPASPWLVSVI